MWEKSRQDQSVSEGGQAIQVVGNLTVNNGMSLAQMAEVMREVRDTAQSFTAEAMVEVEKRIADLQETVLKQFADGSMTNAHAFREPDFQLMIGDAQKAYAHSGDNAVKETLADIISRRSLAANASRLALTLNDAAARAPKLTKTEFAILSLAYLVRHTRGLGINDAKMFADYINATLMPFVDDIPIEMPSYWHIESQSCGRLATGQINLLKVWRPNYAGVLGKGLAEQQVLDHTADANKGMILNTFMPCLRDRALLQPQALTREVYQTKFKDSGIPAEVLDNVWNAFEGTVPGDEDLYAMLKAEIPDIRKLFDRWNAAPIKQLELNSVGIAIGHANASRVAGLKAPLDIWIK